MIRGGIVMLNVGDVGRAVRFYIETLGMKLVEESAGSSIIDAGEGFHIGLRSPSPTDKVPAAMGVTLYPKVPIDEAIAIYENRGVAFTIERTDHATNAIFRDLDNNLLCLTQTK